MAREVIETFVDDLDGSDKEVGTVKFALDGTAYEIDLSADNADDLRSLLAPYIAAGRKDRASLVVKPKGSMRVVPSQRTDPQKTADVRRWASDNGYRVSHRGRISQDIWRAYEAATG